MRSFGLLGLFAMATFTYHTNYVPLQNISMSEHRTAVLIVPESGDKQFEVILEYASQNGQLKYPFVKSQFISSSEKVFKFAKEQYIRIQDCKPNQKLEIYDVGWNVLNQNSEFTWTNNSVNLQGLYDPRTEEPGTSSIVLVSEPGFSKKKNIELIAHETAHYWYDRLCFPRRGWSGSAEEFALSFEEYVFESME